MSWGWRNKPRSVIKTVQWFKYFSNLENENWDYTANKLAANNIKIHPIRRKYMPIHSHLSIQDLVII